MYHKRFTFCNSLFFLFFLTFSVAWGQTTYSYTFVTTVYTANNQTKTLNSVDWTLVDNGNYYGYDNTKGQQVGSGSNPAKSMTLSTSDITGTITKVKISTSGASSVSANVLVKVNGTSYGSAQAITATNTEYTFSGFSSGGIEIIWTQTSSKALYFKKIEVEYSSVPLSSPDLTNQTFSGTVGSDFSKTPTNTGGTATSWSVVSGSLPTGLSLNSSTGEISGTPTTDGTFNANIKAENSIGDDTATYTFNISDEACFNEDFSDITTGDNTTTGGSSAAWNGNTNFPTVVSAYKAGGTVKLGTGSAIGSIESLPLVNISGDISVKIKVKGWTNVEGDLKVSIDGQSKTESYTAKMADDFEEISIDFTNVTVGSKLKIETTAKRAFIDEVIIVCESETEYPAHHYRSKTSGDWTSASSWEESEDGVNWTASISLPSENALSVEIRDGHNIKLNTNNLDIVNTRIKEEAELEITDYDYVLAGSGNALIVEKGGVFIVNGSGKPTSGSTGKALVETGGIFKVVSFSGSNDLVSNYLHVGDPKNKFKFENNSIFSWEAGGGFTLGSSGFNEIFDVVNTGDLVIYKLTSAVGFSGTSYGGGTTNLFHAILEIPDNRNMSLSGAGNKIFEGGVRGNGKLTVTYRTQTNDTGKLIFGPASGTGQLGDAGNNLTLNVPHSKLQLQNIEVPASANVTIESSGTNNPNTIERIAGNLDIKGTLDITDIRIINTAAGGIVVNNGGLLRTKYTGVGGLYGTNAAIPSGTLSINNNSTIEYYGADQKISNLNYYHLKLSGTGIKTPQNTTTIHTDGSVTITGTTTVDFSAKNLADVSGNNIAFNMDGGRLILGTGGTLPKMLGDYNITGGVVEFAGTTAKTIRSNSSNTTGKKYKYQNIEVTGTDVGTSGGNIALKSDGTFTVKNGGIFRIRANSIRCFDSSSQGGDAGTNCSVTVENGGIFQTGNDKGFSGYNAGEFAGNNSSVHANIETINLQNGSTVEYLGDADGNKYQDISNQTGVGQGVEGNYYNLKISGVKINPFDNGVLHVNNITEINNTGKLTVQSTADAATPNVLVASKGIQVAAGGQAIFENNAQLMQDTDAVNNGDIDVKRAFTFSTNRKEYNFLSAPVNDENRYFKTSIYSPNPPSVQAYNEATYYFDEVNGKYIQAKGYAVKEPASGTPEGLFTGEASNGNISYTLQKSTNGGGYNLVGNPYPSNLDIKDLHTSNSTKIEPNFYFWDNRGNTIYIQQGSSYQGNQYAIYNAIDDTGVAATGASGYPLREPTRYVKIGTGFMVQAKSNANGKSLDFKNEFRVAGHNEIGYFGKPSNFDEVKDRYWLTITSPSGMTVMNAVVYFDGGKDDFWIDDTESFGPSDDLFTIVEDKQLSIQGKSPFSDFDKVPLGYRAHKEGYYFIQIHNQEGVFADGQSIYILDRQLNKLHNLSNDGPYKFLTRNGEFTNRFVILYRPTHFWTNSETISNQIDLVKKDNQIVISSSIDKIIEVEVFDLNSRSVYKKTGVNSNNHSLSALSFNNQIIVVTVKTDKGEFITKKFVNN